MQQVASDNQIPDKTKNSFMFLIFCTFPLCRLCLIHLNFRAASAVCGAVCQIWLSSHTKVFHNGQYSHCCFYLHYQLLTQSSNLQWQDRFLHKMDIGNGHKINVYFVWIWSWSHSWTEWYLWSLLFPWSSWPAEGSSASVIFWGFGLCVIQNSNDGNKTALLPSRRAVTLHYGDCNQIWSLNSPYSLLLEV